MASISPREHAVALCKDVTSDLLGGTQGVHDKVSALAQLEGVLLKSDDYIFKHRVVGLESISATRRAEDVLLECQATMGDLAKAKSASPSSRSLILMMKA
jgi:hypothetical protein